MNVQSDKPVRRRDDSPVAAQNLFWVLLILFLALASDYATRLVGIKQQHDTLVRVRTEQAQNINRIGAIQNEEAKVQALAVELVQMARTNAEAKRIVEQFNIQWTPDTNAPAAASAVPVVSTNQNAPTNK
jgi:hypothetical protein